MIDKRRMVTEVFNILSKHPLVKAHKIAPGEIKNWIVETYKVDPERLEWHAKRTSSIGGSEIFTAVAFVRAVKASAQDDYESQFVMQSIQEMVAGKIFRKTPIEPDSHMRRGILSEPLARHVYIENLRKKGHKVEFDSEASDALKKFKSEKYPWLAYNEDDVLFIDGTRTLIDYKCPAPDPVKGLDLTVEEAYLHQLHQGLYCLEQCGFPVLKLKLVKYNVLEATAIEIPVDIDLQIVEENLSAGTYLYENYILKSRMPEYQPQMLQSKSLMDVSQELQNLFSHVEGAPEAATKSLLVTLNKFAFAKALNQASAQQVTALTKQAKDFFVTTGITADNSVLTVGPVEVRLTKDEVINEDAVIDKANELGIDLLKHAKKITYDIDMLLQTVQQIEPEFKPIEYVQSESIVLTRKQKGATADIKSLIVQESEKMLASVLSVADSTGLFDSIEQLIDAYVKTQNSKQNYYQDQWRNAIESFNDYQKHGQAKDDIFDLAEQLLSEGAVSVGPKPF